MNDNQRVETAGGTRAGLLLESLAKWATMFRSLFKRATSTGVRRGRNMGEPFNDGHDLYRIGRAEAKRQRKRGRV